MQKITHCKPLNFLSAITFLLIGSCNSITNPVPFPVNETEFTQPISTQLKFSESQKIKWITNIPDSISPVEINKIDFDKLPVKPFYPDGFRSLAKPLSESTFDISRLPDTILHFDQIPVQHLKIQTSFIEPPVIIKATLPQLRKNATMGIFDFNEDQGLPGSIVTAMLQDSHGMMWIATDKGLCRFDGEYLDIFSFIDVVFTGQLSFVSKLMEDNQGRIWIKTDINGIYILDPIKAVVSHFEIPIVGGIRLNRDNEMITDDRGLVWIGTLIEGIYIVDPKNHTIRHLPGLHDTENRNENHLVKDAGGNIWVGSLHGLSIADRKLDKIHFLNRATGLLSDTITSLFIDKENKIWVGTSAGVDIISLKEGIINHLSKAEGINEPVNHIIEDDANELWMASDSGVYIYNPSSKKLRHIDQTNGLIDNGINTIAKDNSDQIWIATNGGLNLIHAKGLMPEYFTQKQGLIGTDIWTFLDDGQKRLWIGSRNGIDFYYPEKQIIKSINKELLFKNGRSPYLLKSKNGDIIISSGGISSISIINPITGIIKYLNKARGVQSNNPVCLIEDHEGRLWIGNFNTQGIEIIDPNKNAFTILNKTDGISGNIVWGLMQDNTGNIWAATDNGIDIINPADKSIRHLMQGENIIKENAGALMLDDIGRIWIGTRNGILIADQKNELLTQISVNNGLCTPDVYTLFKNKGRIYAGTGDGLTVFTPKKDSSAADKNLWEWNPVSYKKRQGLLYTNFNSGASFAGYHKLWWGIEDKALTITEEPAEDSSLPTTFITGISIGDKWQNFTDQNHAALEFAGYDTMWSANKDTYYTKEKLPVDTGWLQKNNVHWDSLSGYFSLPANLAIPYNQNYISFHFTGTELGNRDKTRYRYILEGIDKNWSAISDNPFSINYRDIPAGKYTFKVCSRGMNGIWSRPAEFSFAIRTPWWNTWWAYILSGVLFGLIVWSIVQYRSRQLINENMLLEKKVQHRTSQLNQSLQELKSTQAQLIQSEKMASLGELTAGIAHEIQNPLNFVNNFSDINNELIGEMKTELLSGNIKEAISIAGNIEENEGKINLHGKRAEAIVKGMMQHSRSGAGVKEPTNINALADEYLRLSYHGIRAKNKDFNVTLNTDFDNSIGKIDLIPQDFGRMLLNLYNNAFYAVSDKKKQLPTGYEPMVSVSTKKTGNHVFIRVKDNGNGIPSKVLDKIFQPFFTTKPAGKGTGLGLSLSYDIVKAHGGEITVETKEGKETTFTIQLAL